MKNLKVFSTVLVLICAITIGLGQVEAKELQPNGKISIDDTQISFIVGGSWGKGVLSYQGVESASSWLMIAEKPLTTASSLSSVVEVHSK